MTPKTSILSKAPFFRYVIALIIGITISDRYRTISPTLIIGSLLVILCFIYFAWKNDQNSKQNSITGLIITLLVITCGIVLKSSYTNQRFEANLPSEGIYSGLVMEKSPSTKNRNKYEVKLNRVKINDQLKNVNETILLYVSDSTLNTELIPGKQITFESKLTEIKSLNNPGEFNYQNYLRNSGIRYQCYLKSGLMADPALKNSLKTIALNVRSKLLDSFKFYGIKGDEFAVLAALTLGEKDFLTAGVKKSYAVSGAMHVLSVSGLHVGIIYLFLSYLLKPLGRSRKLRLLRFSLLFSFLWIYAFITGLSPSVLRSCTMFSFVLTADNIGRKSNIYNSLASSAFFLLIINPSFLYDIGFQLSYVALISIIYFQPKIKELYQPKNKIIEKLWDLFAVSIAAQIWTFPFSVFYFHQFPVYFILSNYIVIPLSGALLYGTFLFYFTTWLPVLAKIIAFILSFITKLLNLSMHFIEEMPGSLVKDLWISESTLILLILVILVIVIYIETKKTAFMLTFLASLFILIFNFGVEQVKTNRQNVVVFYNTYNEPLMSIILGKNHYYYSNSETLEQLSETLLTNSSGYFRTKTATNISALVEFPKEMKKHNNNLLIKDITIAIDEIESKRTIRSEQTDIRWITKADRIEVKKTEKFKALNFFNGKWSPVSDKMMEEGYRTKEYGSLIVHYYSE